MPSSLIFVGLVVLWLLILVPTVARRQQEVARLSPALLSGRVLERPTRHRYPEVGLMERSAPSTVGELVEARGEVPDPRGRDDDRYERYDGFDAEIDDDGRVHGLDDDLDDDLDDRWGDDRERDPRSVAPSGDGAGDADPVDTPELESDLDDSGPRDGAVGDRRGAGPRSGEDLSEDARDGADLRDEDLRDEDLHEDELHEADLHGEDLHGDDLRDEDLHESDVRDGDPDPDAVHDDPDGPDLHADGDREHPPARYRPGRGGFDPEAAAAAAHAKYAFRQRVVLALLVLLLAAGAAALLVSAVFWWVAGGLGLGLAGYLTYLRRQVRIEEAIRARRAARLARPRPVEDEPEEARVAEPAVDDEATEQDEDEDDVDWTADDGEPTRVRGTGEPLGVLPARRRTVDEPAPTEHESSLPRLAAAPPPPVPAGTSLVDVDTEEEPDLLGDLTPHRRAVGE
ncbi:hypothetical protein H7X46_02925 [Pseudonocardia sp. C8]|uniref:divisome protein SepX/GlpR n=1 Tax=Pseudonocardia sp. C8 TaxID=2762759 RepID=UPI001642B5A4|nr:gephyrin-like molybdotransferase receptor GlpR [Pseudonocardia sp. C8]MBC3190015.1 hypothetical protein [Pseudonocardia sp. C8]